MPREPVKPSSRHCPSPERDSVLNALGRLGKASLKHKVRARAKLILDRIPARFPELELVVDQAVDCRNYFVHGSKAKMNYSDEFDQMIFFTEALDEWSKQSSTVSHPFDRFRLDYALRLNDLKRALTAAKAASGPSSATA